MAHGSVTPWLVLGRGDEAGVSGHRLLDADEEHPAGAAQGGLALRSVHGCQIDLAEKDDGWVDADPRIRSPDPGDDRHGAEARRSGRILPQPGPRVVDA